MAGWISTGYTGLQEYCNKEFRSNAEKSKALDSKVQQNRG